MRHRKPPRAAQDRAANGKAPAGIDPREVLSGLEWRSSEPVGFPDRDLGQARLEARGVYSIRIADPDAFRRAFRGDGTVESLQTRLEERIVSRFDHLLKSRLRTIRDRPGLYNELATEMRLEMKEEFSRWGIHLIDFFVTAVVPTPDFQKVLNEQDASAPPEEGEDDGVRLRPPRDGGWFGAGAARTGNGYVLPHALLGDGEACPRCGSTRRAEPCPRCGSSLSETARYCPGCGTPRSR
jgi:membrane protease subunit (stomatin/prohibitin family)